MNEIEKLLEMLEKAPVRPSAVAGDAISAELARPVRRTAVQAIRDSAEYLEFQQAKADGLIRVDAVHQLLGLINTVVGLVVAGR